ncbi:MAG: tetratricopeptide repeat protein [bacterium]
MSSENNTDDQNLEDQLQKHSDSILFARLADSYLKKNRVDEAIQLCEKGLKKYPYYVTGHLILGKCYLAKKLYDQAEKEFKRVLLFDPKYLAAHKYYGDLMREIGWENTCEMSYKKILQIDPLDETAQSMVGEYVIEGEPTPEELDSFDSEFQKSDKEFEAVGPISVSSEEEDLLFQEGEDQEKQTTTQLDEQEPEMDEKKAEEFSYILDDIFKDEVVDDETTTPSKSSDQTSSEDDLISEIQKDTDSFLAGLQSSEEETGHSESDSESVKSKFDESEIQPNLNNTGQQITPPSPSVPNEASEKFSESVTHKKSEGEKIVTPTLGEIYAAQGQYAKAIDVFERLLKKHPENEVYAQKIEMLKQKLAESKNVPKN